MQRTDRNRSFAELSLPMVVLMTCVTCGPASTTPPDAGPPGPVDYSPPGPQLRRLTRSQYQNTLRDLFGDALVLPRAIEPDVVQDGSIAIGASNTSISPRGVEQFEGGAYDMAQQLLRDPMRRTPMLACTPIGVTDDACAATFIRAMGRRIWRRPLADNEVMNLQVVAANAATVLNDFHRGLEYALAALLMSTDFIFRAEIGEPDAAHPGTRRFGAYEFASRLAFFLWDSGPDDALLDAAGDGSLDRPERLSTQVQRMLASPRAHRGIRSFLSDWLRLSRLDSLSKDTQIFPSFAPDLGPSAREEVLRTGEWLTFDQNADFRDLLVTRTTFVNRRLAAVYGVPFPERDALPTAFAQITLPESGPRRGLLGMAATLAANAHPTQTSPTLRGRYIRETILCGVIPDPPVNLNTGIPEVSERAPTLRARVAQHLEAPVCNGCHILMDPQGLGLESFDSIGRYRALDHGVPIDASGMWEESTFGDANGLAALLRRDERFPHCVVTRLFRFAQGRIAQDGETAEVGRLAQFFAWRGYRLRALVEEIATSPAFRRTTMVSTGGMP